MADIPFEHAPEEVEALPIEEAELSAPATLIEEPGTLLETAGETEEVINRIEHTKKNGIAIERKREAHTAEEHTNGQNTELNDVGETIQPPQKPTVRKRTKPVEPASSATESSSPVGPKQPTTSRRKKSVELVGSATEAEDASAPKKPTSRKRKAPAKAALPAPETVVPAIEENATVPENAPSAAVEPEAASAEMPAIAEAASIEAVSEHTFSPEGVVASAESVANPEPAGMSEQEVQKPTAEVEEPQITDEEMPVPASEEARVVIIDTARAGAEELIAPVAVIEQAFPAAESVPVSAPVTERRHLVRSSALVSAGNLGSSLMGMVRQSLVTGAGPLIAGPFNAAMVPMNNFFQLLINGSTSGALVPTFNDYSAPEKRQELRRVIFTLVNLVFLVGLASAIGYALIAPWFINFLVVGYSPADRLLTLQYSQIIFFSLTALGPFAVLMAALFALKEFGWPAFATSAQHVGIILGAIVAGYLSSFYLGKMALPVGVLLGSLGEIGLLIPGLRKHQLSYMFVLDLKHPALRRILKLYFPIAVGFVFTTLAGLLDLHLQSLTPGHPTANTTALASATTLIQFPGGLVATALSIAVLPTLAEHVREGNNERFKETLLMGLRFGLLLMIPAMVGLIVLRTPIVYLLFAHHNYGLKGGDLTALALQNYAYQLPFVAVDQLLIAAFYARKNTIIPVTIGVVSILCYLIVALPFYRTIGMPALAFANAVQNSSHAIILLILLRWTMGSLHIRRTLPAILKICAAAVLMGLVAWGTMALLSHVALFSLNHLLGQFLTLIVAGGLASVVYFGAILLFKVEEISLLKGAILAKLGRR